jgi:two-component system sensor histidine kinase YesM
MVVLIIATLGNLSFSLFKKELIESFANSRQDTLLQINDSVNEYRGKIELLSASYANNAYLLQQATATSDAIDLKVFRDSMKDLKQLIDQSFFFSKIQYELQILCENGLSFSSEESHLETLLNLPKTTWFYQARKQKIETYWQTNIVFKNQEEKINVVSLVTFILDEQGNSLGAILINFNERELYKIYSQIIGFQSTLYLVDKKGQIVSHPMETMVGRFFYKMETFNAFFGEKNWAQIKKSGDEYLFSKYLLPESPWIVVEEIPMAIITDPLHKTSITIELLGSLLLVLALLFAIVFSQKISRPFEILADSMNIADSGDLNIEFKELGCYESRNMAKNSQKFVLKIMSLLEALKLKEKEKRTSELDFLQMQINPHFMYNTLFSIRCMVDIGLKQQACDTLDRFSSMLNKVLRIDTPMISIMDNIDYLEDYNFIMSQRYGTLSFSYEMEEGLEKVKLLKFILQPLVENSVYHGFANGVKPESLIEISFKRLSRNILIIHVKDNGCGIPKAQLEEIFAEKQVNSHKHIGLLNVRKKLELYYEGQASLTIQSIENKGTDIEIVVPITEEDTHEYSHS